MTRRDSDDTEDADGEYRGASILTHERAEDAEPDSTLDTASRRERVRRKLGLTPRQWMVLVSFALFLPYPAFVYVLFATSVDETLFLTVTIAYSLFAIVASLVL